ncbi:formylglycine-generating enzyme family protein [Reichenbachiella sp. MALMAid0571]|uniref:formylglycine-generating enzyme family protein n=1 Tax=Reichenbachiella sp. MALMAid0571 TaxID=3143939 RepID=UPI0032DF168E
MMKIEKGFFVPLYGNDSSVVHIESFFMDIYPVTNREFKEFVIQNDLWEKSKVKQLFADGNYLNHWADNDDYGSSVSGDAPVTNISWFAAKSYCNSKGKRLPTIDEWEYVAMADETKPDARKDEAYNQKILDWYESSRTFGKEVGSTFKNYWGIYDLHGLVWEWTQDFNSVLISGESRKDVNSDKNLFCGSATVGANDLMNYAAFMRFAFRGSIKANYAIKNLGFRCAQSIPKVEN